MKAQCMIIAMLMFMLGLAAQTTMTATEFEAEIFRLTNLERTRHSLPEFYPELLLVDLARHHADNMARQNFFAHEDKEGLDVSGRQKRYCRNLISTRIGENLAYHEHSQRKYSAQTVVTGWMNSPGHRANILNPEFTHLGVAIARTGDKLYSVQVFARPIAKLITTVAKKIPLKQAYRLEFVYLSVEDRKGLEIALYLPDADKKVFIDEQTFVRGIQFLPINWGSGGLFYVDIPTEHGRGVYKLGICRNNSITMADFSITLE